MSENVIVRHGSCPLTTERGEHIARGRTAAAISIRNEMRMGRGRIQGGADDLTGHVVMMAREKFVNVVVVVVVAVAPVMSIMPDMMMMIMTAVSVTFSSVPIAIAVDEGRGEG